MAAPPAMGARCSAPLGNLVTALTLGLAALVALFNREGRDLADLRLRDPGRPAALTGGEN